MQTLNQKIDNDVSQWRKNGYPCQEYPLIKSILAYQMGEEEERQPRYLRRAQLLALEVYWYLRVVKKTPKITDLYKSYYQENELLDVLRINYPKEHLEIKGTDYLIEEFIKDKKHSKGTDSIRESLSLDYPSYIFALAMGAGKTVLIGAIISTEFSMSIAYPDADFMHNALVFAPGKTIIESLRELSSISYENILPPGQYRNFMGNIKIRYLSQDDKIPTNLGEYNIIVTNTEKIILRKENKNYTLLQEKNKLHENMRLAAICDLQNIGVFSDEAHHTYGNKIGENIKRVRETINHIAKETKLICVVNTTGTPYYKKQMLIDVVIWYGLAEGIKQNVLKSLNEGVREYDIPKNQQGQRAQEIIHDFYEKYRHVTLPSGQKAKIAFYFNRQADLDETKPAIEYALTNLNESPTVVLTNTQQSTSNEITEFNRLNDSNSQKRVILLVGKGREGWNCPSLFACALITQQTSASNSVLQSSARCLRQVPGNNHAARIYLDYDNRIILDKELQENFGPEISIHGLADEEQEMEEVKIKILKPQLPDLEINTITKRFIKKSLSQKPLKFSPPTENITKSKVIHRDIQLENQGESLVQIDFHTTGFNEKISRYAAAIKIAAPLHLDYIKTLNALKKAYPNDTLPAHHLPDLSEQAAEAIGEYEIKEEKTKLVLALIHTHNAGGESPFEEKDGCLYHTLRFSTERLKKMKAISVAKKNHSDKYDLSFHYSPYYFDSKDEQSFFQNLLNQLNTKPTEVTGFFFSGGITDPKKTGLWFEYEGKDKLYHKYFPDFVLFKKNGDCFIVEIKAERDEHHPDVKAKCMAVKKLAGIQPEKLKYHVVYCPPADKSLIEDWIKS